MSSSPAGIDCATACSSEEAKFAEGQAVTLSAAPGPGSQPVQWSGCDHVDAEECGSICEASFPHGTVVTLAATPDSESEAVQWSGACHLNGAKCEVTMSEAETVTATFELQPQYRKYPLTVECTGTGEGTVTAPAGSIDCGSLCEVPVLVGHSLTLLATSAPGSVFAGFAGGGCAGVGPCTATVKKATTGRAKFTAVGTPTLSVSRAGGGQGSIDAPSAGIECGTACSAQVSAARKVTLTARAASGSTFAHWSGACTGTVKVCTVTMSEARSVTATFTGPAGAAALSTGCAVPKLAGRSLRAARAALAAAHCSLGKVSRPKARNRKEPHPLVVRRFAPEAGASLPAGAKVDLRLGKAKGGKCAG